MHPAPTRSRKNPGTGPWTASPRRMKETRDRSFKVSELNKKDNKEYVVNRTDGMAFFGGAGLDNEECYLLVQVLPRHGCRAAGTPGPIMTLRYSRRSGGFIRTRGNDESLD